MEKNIVCKGSLRLDYSGLEFQINKCMFYLGSQLFIKSYFVSFQISLYIGVTLGNLCSVWEHPE